MGGFVRKGLLKIGFAYKMVLKGGFLENAD